MVAEMSNECATFIWNDMDIIQGLHFVAMWWQKQRVTIVPLFGAADPAAGSGARTII